MLDFKVKNEKIKKDHFGPKKGANGMSLKKKLAIAVAILGLGALAPAVASAAVSDTDNTSSVSICDIECGTFECWFAQKFTCPW